MPPGEIIGPTLIQWGDFPDETKKLHRQSSNRSNGALHGGGHGGGGGSGGSSSGGGSRTPLALPLAAQDVTQRVVAAAQGVRDDADDTMLTKYCFFGRKISAGITYPFMNKRYMSDLAFGGIAGAQDEFRTRYILNKDNMMSAFLPRSEAPRLMRSIGRLYAKNTQFNMSPPPVGNVTFHPEERGK